MTLSVALAAVVAISGSCASPTRPGSGPEFPAVPPGLPSSDLDHIYVANANGSAVRRLTRGSWPAWSPDGRRIVFNRDGGIHVIDVDGSNDRRLIAGRTPSWSPGGALIVFTSDEGIVVMEADGSNARTVIGHDFRTDTYKPWDYGVGTPEWSPDGSLIVFAHAGDGDMALSQIFLVGIDGSNPRRLTSPPVGIRYAESDPSWSPDGSKIAFWSSGYGIVVAGRDDGVPEATDMDFPGVALGANPAWSPDGRAIAFNRGQFTATPSIWLMWFSGSGTRQWVPNARDLAWSPDGTRIAFVSTRND